MDREALNSRKILIVDDDTVSRIFLRELLTSTGAELSFVRNGYETIKFLETNALPDIVLLDIKLPDIDGVELAKQLLSIYPNLKIVAETAYSTDGLEEKCNQVGIMGCVYKPINQDELLNLLLKVVE